MRVHPSRLFGVFVADPAVGPAAEEWLERLASSSKQWVGVRFNPYKWPAGQSMADDTGKALFRKAGELSLPVGFMPFKGLSQHVEDIEALMKSSPSTQVIIDHWGFFLQPATGFGERALDEASWEALLRLSSYPQVHVKISALFRVSQGKSPFPELSERLQQLLSTFGSARLLWGSDFPYATEHTTYAEAVLAPESWPAWAEMSEEDRTNLVHDTAAKLYGLPLAREGEL
ncbi:ligI [Symbiodinium natans]|uniref:LigI protein n=1 Tax=Symbiodinium natans TaxID=878477 RepID=A0A812UFK1_9DINO|nr:ligI [Symbiodinium natans]